MATRNLYISASAATAVANGAFNPVEITDDVTVQSGALPFPTECTISYIEFTVTGIVATTQLLVYLSWDAAGIRPFTDTLTISLVPGTGASQGCAARVQLDMKWPNDATPGSIWAQIDTDAGNVTVVARAYWSYPQIQ